MHWPDLKYFSWLGAHGGKLLTAEIMTKQMEADVFANTSSKTQLLTNVHRQIVTTMVRVN